MHATHPTIHITPSIAVYHLFCHRRYCPSRVTALLGASGEIEVTDARYT
jgi:hypothetical protein